MIRWLACVLACGLAATASARVQGLVSLGECPVQNGAVIEDCKLGFTQFGIARSDGSNVIVVPSWLSAQSGQMMEFFRGLADELEGSGYSVIVVDMFGNGVSSSPSNSAYQRGYAFPLFSISDAVGAQHRLLTEHFGLDHVKAVIGLSMGGLQALQWSVQFPDFMDKVVDVVGTPRPTRADRTLWRSQVHLIEASRATPTSVTLDLRAQLMAMLDHDILPGGTYEDMAQAIRADMFTIAARYDKMVTPAPSIALARARGTRLWVTDSWCGHFAPAVCHALETREVIRDFVLDEN